MYTDVIYTHHPHKVTVHTHTTPNPHNHTHRAHTHYTTPPPHTHTHTHSHADMNKLHEVWLQDNVQQDAWYTMSLSPILGDTAVPLWKLACWSDENIPTLSVVHSCAGE